ncbi:MAG: exonuclease subunit SbcD [Campylobacterota bacterium]|nr:exonuclease subunit SbcD [Campylobacterota bacterium]
MNILHTSDWHLGQNFKSRSRKDEHQQFLSWLIKEINLNNIDILIIAGDIFDTTNPPNYALKMYHNFLASIIKTTCKNIIIVAGNHDSISTLEITKDMIKPLGVHIVASGENIDETIVPIRNENEEIKAIVCAVPFLRDKVIRDANKTYNNSEIEKEFKDGIKSYYQKVYNIAKKLSSEVPIIATGHFTTTGATINPNSEREIYIGKLQNIDSDILSMFDYVAMGHIHKAQKIGKNDNIRYSGSPIALSFSEYNQQKSIVKINFDKKDKEIKTIDIPCFKNIVRIEGDIDEVKSNINKVKDINNRPFIEVVLTNNSILNIDIKDFIKESFELGVDVIAIKRKNEIIDKVLNDDTIDIRLNELNPLSVFEKRMEQEEYIIDNIDLKEKLILNYKNILQEIEENENK